MAPPSARVTYQGDARFPDQSQPFEISGFPFAFPANKPVEITEAFVRETFNREDFRDFLTMLFDGENAMYNLFLRSPRFTLAWTDGTQTSETPETPETPPTAEPEVTPEPEPEVTPEPEAEAPTEPALEPEATE